MGWFNHQLATPPKKLTAGNVEMLPLENEKYVQKPPFWGGSSRSFFGGGKVVGNTILSPEENGRPTQHPSQDNDHSLKRLNPSASPYSPQLDEFSSTFLKSLN